MSIVKPGAAYRPDIDGLRALAVLLVVCCHLRVGRFSGGYIGVDVFFVISGFLITRLIVQEVREGRGFSFRRFYARRVRRILPALIATCAVTAVFAFLLLPSADFARFGASLGTAALSVSNVFFSFSSGYFDDSQIRPLLHLWSLSVEEQFYALWPLLLVLLLKRSDRLAIWTVAVAGLMSAVLAQWWLAGHVGLSTALPSMARWLDDANDAAFYLMPFRVFELAIGALMVWAVARPPDRPLLREALLLAGLALILGPAVVYSDQTTFPGLAALVPCLGTALVIYVGATPKTGWLLRNRIAVGLGLISYSIYLLHWPLIVLVQQYRYADPGPAGKLAMLAILLAGAAALYRWIEQPCRNPTSGRRGSRTVVIAAVVAILFLGAAGATVWAEDGWAWRVPPARQGPTLDEWIARERSYCGHRNPAVPHDLAPCQNERGKPRTLVVWGDSHALHLVAGLSEVYPEYNVFVFYRPGCMAASGFLGYETPLDDRALETDCVDHNRKTLSFLERYPPAVVVLSNTKRDTPEAVAAPTADVVSKLRAAGHMAVLLGDFMRPGISPIACRSVPVWLIPDAALADRCAADPAQLRREWRYSDGLLARLPEVIDVRPVQCPAGTCVFWADDGTAFFRDSNHLSTAGAIHFIRALSDRLPIDAGAAGRAAR